MAERQEFAINKIYWPRDAELFYRSVDRRIMSLVNIVDRSTGDRYQVIITLHSATRQPEMVGRD